MDPDRTQTRKAWMGLMARSPEGRLSELVASKGLARDVVWLRRPEIGSVMIRGRAGATGAAFNLGEMTVTRCSMEYGGVVGHGYVQGRRKPDAEAAALVDALMQTDAADAVRRDILTPLETEENARRTARARKAAATRVEFFTLVRGEA